MKKILTVGMLGLMLFLTMEPSMVEAASKNVGGSAEFYKIGKYSPWDVYYDCGTSGYQYHEVSYQGYYSTGSNGKIANSWGKNYSCEYDAKHEKRTFKAETINGNGDKKGGVFRRWGNTSTHNQLARGTAKYGGHQGTWG